MGLEINREAIYTALFERLVTCGPIFKTYSRVWKSTWDDPQARLALLPMLVLWDSMEDITYKGNRGIGAIRTIDGIKLEVYAKIPERVPPAGPRLTVGVPNSTTAGSQVLNPLLDAIDNCLQPGRDGVNTLGGLVTDCRIEGKVIKVTGDADPSGLCGLIVPLQLLVP